MIIFNIIFNNQKNGLLCSRREAKVAAGIGRKDLGWQEEAGEKDPVYIQASSGPEEASEKATSCKVKKKRAILKLVGCPYDGLLLSNKKKSSTDAAAPNPTATLSARHKSTRTA